MGKGNLAHEQPSSTGWGALFSVHTAKDVCAAAVTPHSPSHYRRSPGRMRSAPSGQHQFRVEPNLEPQVLFVHPPDKQLPLRSKDLLSFCFPDDSILYGGCVLVDELVQQPSRLISLTEMGKLFRHHSVESTKEISAAAVTPPSHSARPSVVFSSKGDSGSPLEKLQSQVFRLLKGLTPPFNCNGLACNCRLWILKEPSRLFESTVVVGLHPSCDIQALKRQYFGRRPKGPERLRGALSGQHQFRVEPSLEPQGSPSEDRSFRSDVDSADTEEAPFSGQEGNEQNDILDWAKTNNHGSLQIIYETILHMAGSTVDLMSCSTSFELAKARRAFALEEEATALSVWAISCLCGSLRLDHVLTIFAGALLEKQIVFSCLCALIWKRVPRTRVFCGCRKLVDGDDFLVTNQPK
ncbi:hypothetical protein Tco_0915199 [Tanacetum coccineum]